MKNQEKFQHYLRDLVYIIKEQQAELNAENNDDDFSNGIAYGYSSIIDLIKNQADAFQIKTSEFGFNDFEEYTSRN